MSGLYNMVIPQHPAARALLDVYILLEGADDTYEEVLSAFRYRNFYPMEDGTAILLTRLGDHDTYHEQIDAFREHPHYISDDVWDTDETYRSFVFKGIPELWEKMQDHALLMDKSPTQVFGELLEKMAS